MSNIDKDIEIVKEIIKPFKEEEKQGKKLVLNIKGIKYEQYQAISNVLSELEKKDKIIDLMAEFIYNTTDYEDEKIFNFKNEQEVKEYFREEAKDNV